MGNRVSVTDERGDLERFVWTFTYLGRGAILDVWRHEKRETKRHKFKAHQYDGTEWRRLEKRGNRIPEPDVPYDIWEEALGKFASSVKRYE